LILLFIVVVVCLLRICPTTDLVVGWVCSEYIINIYVNINIYEYIIKYKKKCICWRLLFTQFCHHSFACQKFLYFHTCVITSFRVILESVGLGEGTDLFMSPIHLPSVTVLLKYDLYYIHIYIPAFYETRSFITAFTTARHRSLSGARSIKSMPSVSLLEVQFLILSPI
jgi:hypothetical protein